MHLSCRNRTLDLSHPKVMGVLNVTPDSFSDGGEHLALDDALRRAEQMLAEGAAIIDVGGESTRPGAQAVEVAQEIERVVPVIERLSRELDVVVSVDTMKPEVMREAVQAGAHLINDVNALQAKGALTVAADTQAGVCLMHMQGEPRTMQANPQYEDVLCEVTAFLQNRAEACMEAGVARECILLDPGFGFGKTLSHNLQLMAGLTQFAELGLPVLVGVSRKSMLGAILDLPPQARLHGGTAAAVLACWQGARVVRTHDVAATVEALKVVQAVQEEKV